MMPLSNGTLEVMSYYELLDRYTFKVDFEVGLSKWTVFSYPGKITAKCDEVLVKMAVMKVKYNENMRAEQVEFNKSLSVIEETIVKLDQFSSLQDVQAAADLVKQVEETMTAAQEKIKLYNARETLFEQELTDYEDFNRVVKLFDPYSALWYTANEWITLFEFWMKGKFVDLNAEDVERKVDKYFNAISKAAKYFVKMEMHDQVC